MGYGAAKRIAGPAYLAASATNIYTPPASTLITYIGQLHFANKTASDATATVYVGATGGSSGGTEIVPTITVTAHETRDFYFSPPMQMISTDFLSGLSGTASAVTITVLGYQNATP